MNLTRRRKVAIAAPTIIALTLAAGGMNVLAQAGVLVAVFVLSATVVWILAELVERRRR